jgi:pyridoxamine 5'-phosphate oxidase
MSLMKLEKFRDLDRIQKKFRKEYHYGKLEEKNTARNPLEQFSEWFMEAVDHRVDKPNAMTLVTATRKGIPGARTVLLKGFDEKGFTFYTHYDSPKAAEMKENPRVSLLFYWPEVERQVRIDGRVTRISAAESETYFSTRPRDAQIGAWIAQQSCPLKDRESLEDCYSKLHKKFSGGKVPRPSFWGGYRVSPFAYEFWQGRENRLNDRLLFKKNGREWKMTRLYP